MSDAGPHSAPGWYGKLPSLGDFASRRLPHELIEAWDAWLAEELGSLREQDPGGWLPAYLDSPTWRFVLAAGVLGETQPRPLAGVLMPSVDRVGRYFPLTILAPLDGLPHSAEQAQALFNWLHALDDVAADALQDDWPIETLDTALARLPAPALPALTAQVDAALSALSQGDTRLVALPTPATRQALAQDLGQALWMWACGPVAAKALPPGPTWWWAEPVDPQQAPRTLLGRGLPAGLDFHALMGRTAHPATAGLGDTAPSDHHAA